MGGLRLPHFFMASEVSICNQALDLVGGAKITALSDETAEGRLCNRNYSVARDALLGQHPWRFARERTTLAPLAAAPEFGYTYQFQLPADYINIIGINGDVEATADYVVEGRKLLYGDDTLELIYVSKVTDVGLFPQLFIDALAYGLAAQICYPLTQNRTQAQELRQMYFMAARDAIAADMQQSPQKLVHASGWLDSRNQTLDYS